MILTSEQKREYVENGAQLCPVCKSPDISAYDAHFSGMQAWQNVSCDSCKHTWRDVYKFDFVETDEELECVK